MARSNLSFERIRWSLEWLLLYAHGRLAKTPFIIRWPNKIPAGRVSNEIVDEVDTYTTFAKLAGAKIPQDRPIDGVDQSDFFLGKPKSNREGFPVYVADRMEAVFGTTRRWPDCNFH